MRRSIALTVAACTILACGPTAPPRPVSTTAGSFDATEARVADEQPSAPLIGPPAPEARCIMSVSEAQGCSERDVAAVVAPVRTRLERCSGSSGGKLSVRIQSVGGKLTFDVQPDSSLDPTEKQCVLDALVKLHTDETATAWTGGQNVWPSGFTSLLTIEW